MFTLTYYDCQDDGDVKCRIFEDAELMGDWVKEFYEGTDYEENPPILVFPGQVAPLKCRWSMILEPGALPPQTRTRKARS